MAKMLVVCSKCYTFFSADKDKRVMRCSECGGELEPVDRDYLWYSALSSSEKEEFKKQYVLEHYHVDLADTKSAPFQPVPQSSWVGFMGCCGWLAVIGLLIAGILACVFGSFVYGLALMLAAPFSGGAMILFSIVAEDVRHIRNQVDKLHYDRDHQ